MPGVVAGLIALSACHTGAEPRPQTLDAQVIEFDASGFYGPPFAAVIDSEAAARSFTGWFATREDRSYPVPQVVAHPELFTDLGTYTYLAMVTGTGCRAPVEAELRRMGTDVVAALLGGVDRPECVRAYTPFVVYKVRRADIDGVTTVGGAPVDRDGPAELVGKVELSPTATAFEPREVTEPAQRTALVDELSAAAVDSAAMRTTVEGTSRLLSEYGPADLRRYAFPVRACPDDVVTLRISAAELHAVANTAADAPRTCEAPTAHLAVFDVRGMYVPDGARLVG
ncbi:hypothetical protein [Nocardia sp. NPDC005366]|uniref:hypothetical protein n=1 Tax=Nocardia sp. NPDC005366 TaxID=3156878 RepID=UPI0033BE0513